MAESENSTSGSLVCTIMGHSSSVWKSSYSSDASYICTCSSDESVKIWTLPKDLSSTSTTSEFARLADHVGVVRGCDFAPNSAALLSTCSWDKRILLYRTADLKVACELLGHRYGVCYVKFSPCGRFLLSCSWDDTIGVWDVNTGTLLHFLEGHSSPVSACTFMTATSGGSLLAVRDASCSWDGTVKVWDIASPRAAVITMAGHPDAVYDVSSSSSHSEVLASCGRKGSFIIWDLRSASPLQMFSDKWIEFNCVSFSPSGHSIAVGNSMGQMMTWKLDNLQTNLLSDASSTVQVHASSVTDLNYSTDGSLLATCSTDHTCKVWRQDVTGESAVASLTDSLMNQLTLNS